MEYFIFLPAECNVNYNFYISQIDQIIDELIYYPAADFEGPLKLQSQLDSNALAIIAQIRKALSVLFHFSRKLSPNKVI